MSSTNTMPRLPAALLSGLVAIAINTSLLAFADRLHIRTARGGLLTLILEFFPSGTLTFAKTYGFQQFFHIAVGVGMAVLYAYSLGFVNRTPLYKGMLYAFVVWLMNAFVVLPLLGQGIAGNKVLPISGIVIFSIIHTLFFVVMSLLFHRWCAPAAAQGLKSGR